MKLYRVVSAVSGRVVSGWGWPHFLTVFDAEKAKRI